MQVDGVHKIFGVYRHLVQPGKPFDGRIVHHRDFGGAQIFQRVEKRGEILAAGRGGQVAQGMEFVYINGDAAHILVRPVYVGHNVGQHLVFIGWQVIAVMLYNVVGLVVIFVQQLVDILHIIIYQVVPAGSFFYVFGHFLLLRWKEKYYFL